MDYRFCVQVSPMQNFASVFLHHLKIMTMISLVLKVLTVLVKHRRMAVFQQSCMVLAITVFQLQNVITKQLRGINPGDLNYPPAMI